MKNESHQSTRAVLIACVCLLIQARFSHATDQPANVARYKHQITGLFSNERVDDLRFVCENLVDVKLISIDFERAEATFEYDPANAFRNSKPDQIVEQLDNRLRSLSNHTFGVKPLCLIPREKLKRIEIPVVGLDCKACSLGAYEIVYRLNGVEMATASFKEGRVVAWIDPEKIDRVQLEASLKQRGVTLKGSN